MNFAQIMRALFIGRRTFFFSSITAFFFLFSSCSQKRNTFTSRTFHSMVAHYNGLYWANVNLTEGIENVERAHKDDYGKILPVFKYGDDKIAKANYAQFDKAIEKTNKVIQYNSMMIDGKEYCRWIDQNYLTMGKAHFYKRDYYAAVDVFEYVVKVFANKSSKYDAFLWLVRCYNQMNSVIKTGPILDLLKHDSHLPKRLYKDYYSVLSDYYLRTEQLQKAKESLIRAIGLTHKKKIRARYYYILAQLSEQEKDLKKASDYYGKVARLHPSYEMEFNARLSRARTFQIDKGSDTKELKNELEKMLRDAKNKEYVDQIYYALGDLSYREHDVPKSLACFKLAAQNSVINPRQKGMSYLRVADIYFDKRDYKPSQAYYDSTIAFLPSDYKNYEFIRNKKESLTSMIKDVNIIYREDSLLKLSQMDTAQIHKVISGIIEKIKQDEENKKKEQEVKKDIVSGIGGSTPSQMDNSLASIGTGGAAWYFYNTAAISSGYTEFFKKWGNRKLEDDWRRNNKETILAQQVIQTDSKDTTSGNNKIAPEKTQAYYFKDIPFTEDQRTKSKQKIIEAYYALGGIYKEDLQDNNKAAETFEELLKQYPSNKYILNLYYQLYRIYLGLNNTSKAEYYKNKILKDYPDSEYARIIKNPDYQKALLASENEIEKFYGETFSAYNKSQYNEVIAMANKADSFYSSSNLMPKFALLRAYSIGKTSGSEAYEKALQGIIAKYPKDAAAKAKTQELLDVIKKYKVQPVDTASHKSIVAVPVSPFVYHDSAQHQCIVILPGNSFNMDDFKSRILNFNSEFFHNADLSISDMVFDKANKIIIIEPFTLASKAKDYYDLLNQDSKVFKDIPIDSYKVFPISMDNFTILIKDKNIDEYNKFFISNFVHHDK